ncbi:zinc finger BED domain-containing protein 4 [Microcaecilia unicolor]|uniref:Zinc finger BED domain-containing protein 4-like n=1 Tax=Microcaecilia unicolor TaxID=1415580 RepID=A0A6P7ZK07_9AMPH|nr:zinc finger BED domain-containing protein 4-like [Microcaecilia unicolor]
MPMNPIWNFFEKVAFPGKAKCNKCDRLFSLGSDKPKFQTVHGLKSHLAKCHKDVNDIYLKQVADKHNAVACKRIKVEVVAEPIVPAAFIQPTRSTTMGHQVPFADDSEAAKRIDKAIMDVIIVDMLPYSIVEGEAFRRLNFTDPAVPRRYKLKSEKYYRTSLMPATYNTIAEHVKKLLTEAKWVSFTTNVWSNPTRTCSLLSFMGHFLRGPTRSKLILSAMVLEEEHDGVYLASKLQEAVTLWGLQGKVHIGVCDNGANMISALRIAGIHDVGCVARTLQLVVHEALFTQASVEALIKKARTIVTHFQHSEQACQKFADCQKSCSVPLHKLLQDTKTCWNSTYIMLERMVEQRRAVNLFSVEHGGINALSSAEWELVERVVNVLQPFYAAMLEISADDACISVVIPLIAMLQGKMQSTSDDRGLLQMKAVLCDAMNRHFAYVKTAPHTIAATLLDPRFKDIYLTGPEVAAAKAEIIEFLRSINSIEEFSAVDLNIVKCEFSTDQQSESVSPLTWLWEAHDNLPIESVIAGNEWKPVYEQQLAAYLKEPCVPRSTNIFGYWHCSQFPSLEPAASKYLSAPPTSTASERLFSSAGQLYAERRSTLPDENVEKLLFLSYNIRLLEFNY